MYRLAFGTWNARMMPSTSIHKLQVHFMSFQNRNEKWGSVAPWNVQKPTNVQTPTFVQTFRPQMCKQPHLCKHFAHKCANNHICTNISPTNVQICKKKKKKKKKNQPQMCKHHAYNLCKRSVLTWNVQTTSRMQFTSTKLSTDDKLVLTQYLYTQVRSLGAIFSEGP